MVQFFGPPCRLQHLLVPLWRRSQIMWGYCDVVGSWQRFSKSKAVMRTTWMTYCWICTTTLCSSLEKTSLPRIRPRRSSPLSRKLTKLVSVSWCYAVIELDGLTGSVQILEKYGKSWDLMWKFSRPWKVLKMTIGMEKSGKILQNCNVDLENTDVCYTVDYRCIC